MKVWRCEGRGGYSGGIAIVVAKTLRRAVELTEAKSTWPGMQYLYENATELTELVPKENREGVVHIFEYGE